MGLLSVAPCLDTLRASPSCNYSPTLGVPVATSPPVRPQWNCHCYSPTLFSLGWSGWGTSVYWSAHDHSLDSLYP